MAKACVDALGRHIDRLLSSLASTPEDLDRVGRHAAALGLHRLARYVAERRGTISAASDGTRLD